jgi:hypothetical protein
MFITRYYLLREHWDAPASARWGPYWLSGVYCPREQTPLTAHSPSFLKSIHFPRSLPPITRPPSYALLSHPSLTGRHSLQPSSPTPNVFLPPAILIVCPVSLLTQRFHTHSTPSLPNQLCTPLCVQVKRSLVQFPTPRLAANERVVSAYFRMYFAYSGAASGSNEPWVSRNIIAAPLLVSFWDRLPHIIANR